MELPFNTVYSKDILGGVIETPVADWTLKREWVNWAFDELAAAGYSVSSAYTMVKNPGRVDITGPMTLLDSIAQAGGFTEFANRSRIVLMRVENKQQRRFEVDYNRIISGYGTDNYALLPGDIVVVP